MISDRITQGEKMDDGRTDGGELPNRASCVCDPTLTRIKQSAVSVGVPGKLEYIHTLDPACKVHVLSKKIDHKSRQTLYPG